MVYTLAWGLMVVVILGVALHSADQADRRRLEEQDRRIRRIMEELDTPEQRRSPQRPYQNKPYMRDWSGRPRTGPENAKYEGVNRERRNN